jgi:hypothetical protein
MVNPKILCRQHLLGEHKEIHMLMGCLRINKTITGYMRNHLISLSDIYSRHEELVKEMHARGYKHASPIGEAEVALLIKRYENVMHYVALHKSILDLATRCDECHRNMAYLVN